MRALVLGSNPVFALNAVQALGAAGMEAHVMTDWCMPRLRFSRYCTHYVQVHGSLFKPGAQLELEPIERHCAEHGIDVVIPSDMGATLALSMQRARIATPVFPLAQPSLLHALHDKWRFNQLLSELGLRTPCTRLLEPDARVTSLDLTYPIIAKPPASEGGDRVERFDTPAALESMRVRPERRGLPWLVQERIPGRDIDLSLLADRGRVVAWTIQVEAGPGRRCFLSEPRVLEFGQRIASATGFHGLAHFDMRIDERDGALYALECNPRIWGSLMHSVWAGVNFIALGCQLALGQELEPFVPASGDVQHQGFSPGRMLKALLSGRMSPIGMNEATLASWRQAHADPLPQLIGNLTESVEYRLRRRSRDRRAST